MGSGFNKQITMNTQLFSLSIIELILSIGFSIAIIFFSYKLMIWLFFKDESIQKNNIAFHIFTSGIILSIGIILSEIVPSITNIIRISSTQTNSFDLGLIIKYSCLYLFVGFLVTVFINAAVFLLFGVLTKGLNEFKEIKNNNIGVALIIAVLILSITLIVKDSISLLISSLIPYPEVTNYI